MSDTSIRIRTNNVPRDLIDWHDLSETERKEFDYLDTEEAQDCRQFFRYRGHTYDLGEFSTTDRMPFQGTWDYYAGDSYFSGVLVRFVNDYEQVIVATYMS